jgi:hypothetical protein
MNENEEFDMNTRLRFTLATGLFITLLTAILSFPMLQAQEVETMPENRNEMLRETVLRIVDEAFIPGDMEVLDTFVAEDYVVHSPFGDLDRETLKGFLGGLRNALSDFEAVRNPIVVEGDLVATRNVWTGVFSHEFPSPWGVLQPNDEPFRWEFLTIFRFSEEGMIVEEWAQTDVLSFLTQLDAPLPAS